MPFTKEIPEWNAAGAEPPQSLKDSGWSPDDRPPAEYWNWQMNLTFLALQELQQLAETKGHASKHASSGSDPISPSDIGAEPSFVKNTAFNKDFGTSLGTVAEGDHGHIPSEVGLGNVTNDQQATKTEFNDLVQRIGQNSNLSTTDKSTIIAALNEVDQSTKTHQANYVPHIPFAVASGSENTYAVTLDPVPTAYVNGMAVSVAINVDATGASTLNVNSLGAIPIKKANGNDVTNLKQNGVYSFRYYDDGTNQAFILQGEGGEGTATTSDVLSGETFTNDDGLKTGTMPNNGSLGTYTPGTSNQSIPNGYTSGGTVAGDSDLVASNIKAGTSIFGVAGMNTVVDVGDTTTAQTEVLNGQYYYDANGNRVEGDMPNRGSYNITPGTSNKSIISGYHSGSGVVYSIGGNASASEVLSGNTFSSNTAGRAVSGTMPNNGSLGTYTPGTSNQSIPSGYTSGGTVAGDSDLVSSNIKNGVSIFGISGSLQPNYEASGSDTPNYGGSGSYAQDRLVIRGLAFSPKVVHVDLGADGYSVYINGRMDDCAYQDDTTVSADTVIYSDGFDIGVNGGSHSFSDAVSWKAWS